MAKKNDSFNITIDSRLLDSFLRSVPSRLAKARHQSLEDSAQEVQNRAKDIYVPVVTGNLKRSITHEVKRDMAIVGTDVEYAEIREKWNRKTGTKGYLKLALDASGKAIEQIFYKNLEKALK